MTPTRARLVLADAAPDAVVFAGDSFVRTFDGLLFADPERPGVNILTKSRWRAYFRSAMFFSNGHFDEYMTRLWWELRCIAPVRDRKSDLYTPFVYQIFEDIHETIYLEPRAPESHVIVVSCGGIDAWDVMHELYPHRGFELDPVPEGLGSLQRYEYAERIEMLDMYARVEERCAPVFDGLRALRDAGFTRLFLVGLPPPSLEQREGWKPTQLMYLTYIAFNRVYAAQAERLGIGFLDAWDEFTVDGLRNYRFFADAWHLNTTGAALIVNQLYRKLENATA